jgi:hypothetical protein
LKSSRTLRTQSWFDFETIELVPGPNLQSRVFKCKSKNKGLYFFRKDKVDFVRTEDLLYVLQVFPGRYGDNKYTVYKFIKQCFRRREQKDTGKERERKKGNGRGLVRWVDVQIQVGGTDRWEGRITDI